MSNLISAMRFALSLISVSFFLIGSHASAQVNDKLFAADIAVRTVLGFKVADEKVRKMLPSGWEPNAPTTGPSKGVNFSIVLINPTIAQDSEGKNQPARNYAVLVAPAKKTGTDMSGSMVFGGFAAQEDVPGGYGVYGPANVTVSRHQQPQANGGSTIDETWEVQAVDGSKIKINLEFARGILTRNKIEAKVYSALKPEFYRIYRFDQSAETMPVTTTVESRIKKISITASGPKLSQLLDGSEQLIAVTSIPHYIRSIYLPVF